VAVEHGGRGHFFTAEGLGDGFEGEVLGFFGGEENAAVVGEFGGGGLLWGGLLVFGGFAMYVLSRFEDSESYVEGCDRLTAGGSLCCHLC
jgi:hypothetical protein